MKVHVSRDGRSIIGRKLYKVEINGRTAKARLPETDARSFATWVALEQAMHGKPCLLTGIY